MEKEKNNQKGRETEMNFDLLLEEARGKAKGRDRIGRLLAERMDKGVGGGDDDVLIVARQRVEEVVRVSMALCASRANCRVQSAN